MHVFDWSYILSTDNSMEVLPFMTHEISQGIYSVVN